MDVSIETLSVLANFLIYPSSHAPFLSRGGPQILLNTIDATSMDIEPNLDRVYVSLGALINTIQSKEISREVAKHGGVDV